MKLNWLERHPSSSPLALRFTKYLVSMTWPQAPAGRTPPAPVHTPRTGGGTIGPVGPQVLAVPVPAAHFRKLFSGMNRVRLRSFLPDPSSSK